MGKSSGSESDRSRKKSKKQRDRRQNSRSRSPASSSSRSSSRSRSISKYQNRRRSTRESRSRSPVRNKRNRHSRSRSKERSFKSHSKSSSSRVSNYSGSSRSRRNNRSRSRSRSRDRRDSRDSKHDKDDKTTQKKSQDSTKKITSPSSPSQDKNADDQLKAKLQMALKAAADADALLREQGVLTGVSKDWGRFVEEKEKSPPKEKIVPAQPPMLISEQLERAKALDNINAPGFRPQSFTSGKTNPIIEGEKLSMTSHDAAIFGTEAEQKSATTAVEPDVTVTIDKDSFAHENLFMDLSLKEERWIKKLMYMRQRKLNGEAMF